MIDEKALFKLSYGLYIAGVEWGGKKNACIINTAAQATAEPNQMLVTMRRRFPGWRILDSAAEGNARNLKELPMALTDREIPIWPRIWRRA